MNSNTRHFLRFILVLPLVLLATATLLHAADEPKGKMPGGFEDKDLAERAAYWMHQLRYTANPEDNDEARKNLIALGPKAVATMLKEAEGEKGKLPFVHWNICLVLGKMGNEASLPYLMQRLEPVGAVELKARPEWSFVRAYAALALGKVNDPGNVGVPKLLQYLKDEDESSFVRRSCALALGTKRHKPSVPLLKNLLLDKNNRDLYLRGAAGMALGMFPGDKDGSAEALAAYVKLPEEDRHAMLDKVAVQAIGMQRLPGSGAVLRPWLESKDYDLLGSTIVVLGWLGDRESIPALTKILKDANAPNFTRCNAAVALNALGQAKDAEILLRHIIETSHDRNSVGTVAYASVALGEFGGDDNLKTLHQLVMKNESPVATLNGVNSLGKRKDPRMVPVLVERFDKLSGSNNQYVRGEIARALLSHPAQESIRATLLQGMKDHSAYVRRKCAISLAKYPSPQTEAALIDALDDRSYEVRGEAAVSLGVLKANRALNALNKALKDKSDWVRMRAYKAIENILKYGRNEFQQASGLTELVSARLQVVGGGVSDEMSRLYLQAYTEVLELDKPYSPGARVW